jgi:hypothetical protein
VDRSERSSKILKEGGFLLRAKEHNEKAKRPKIAPRPLRQLIDLVYTIFPAEGMLEERG